MVARTKFDIGDTVFIVDANTNNPTILECFNFVVVKKQTIKGVFVKRNASLYGGEETLDIRYEMDNGDVVMENSVFGSFTSVTLYMEKFFNGTL